MARRCQCQRSPGFSFEEQLHVSERRYGSVIVDRVLIVAAPSVDPSWLAHANSLTAFTPSLHRTPPILRALSPCHTAPTSEQDTQVMPRQHCTPINPDPGGTHSGQPADESRCTALIPLRKPRILRRSRLNRIIHHREVVLLLVLVQCTNDRTLYQLPCIDLLGNHDQLVADWAPV